MNGNSTNSESPEKSDELDFLTIIISKLFDRNPILSHIDLVKSGKILYQFEIFALMTGK